MWIRLKALFIKEFLAILRDPKSRAILIGPPIIQLLVFTYAATLEVRNVDLVYVNYDTGRWGQELLHRIDASATFRSVEMVRNTEELQDAIDMRRSIVAVQIGPDFSRNIAAGREASVQIMLDGRRSNAAQIVAGYLSQITSELAADVAANRGVRRAGPPKLVPRNWFNPNLEYAWFTVPNLIGAIALLIGLIVTALSIARERELGTFDQLMVSPLRTHEILIGKLIPPLLIGLVHITLYVLAAVWIFDVPLVGSLVFLYICAICYLAAVVGIGLVISALAATQQQAILGAFLFLVPATLLSGFATPIENMPSWLQTVTLGNPLRYFLAVVRGVFLKGVAADEVARQTLPLIMIAIVTLGSAAWLFSRKSE